MDLFFLFGLAMSVILAGLVIHTGVHASETTKADWLGPWRQINLSIGDGYLHTEACPSLSALRAAGWTIVKTGNERNGEVTLILSKK